MTTMEAIFRSWQLSAELHSFEPAALTKDFKAFEEEAGWRLPQEWRALYAFSNGADLFFGNLRYRPLAGDEGTLIDSSESFRQSGWPVPAALWIAGTNGEGDPFGLWHPGLTEETAPVVELGQLFEPGCMAVAGRTLRLFLLIRTANFLLSRADEFDTQPALDVLGVPAALRDRARRDVTWDGVARWADPTWRDGQDNPYGECLTARGGGPLSSGRGGRLS
jgi:SMI1/KNR4 family protein SUKH-1